MLIVDQVQQQLHQPLEAVCRELAVPSSSLRRWRERAQAGEALVEKPGPAKVEPLNLEQLETDVRALEHGAERTHGTGALYRQYRAQISRRDFQALVEGTRREVEAEEAALARRIDWLAPGLVWSLDDTKKHWLEEHRFGHMHLGIDLASRYHLCALGDTVQADGWRVAMNLEELFHQHGAPLFLKTDGGSNLNHDAVRRLLAAWGVIPLVSPPYYPPYNGGVERGHQEILRQLVSRIGQDTVDGRVLRLECAVAAHDVNHKQRRSLDGHTACRAFALGRPLVKLFDHRKRKEAYDEICALSVDITAQLHEHAAAGRDAAFRYAAETWMQSNHIIRVTRNGKVLPTFYRFSAH